MLARVQIVTHKRSSVWHQQPSIPSLLPIKNCSTISSGEQSLKQNNRHLLEKAITLKQQGIFTIPMLRLLSTEKQIL